MKLLALEHEVAGTKPDASLPLLKAEARRVWELQQEDILREVYFRQDRSAAVLVLECENVVEAQTILASLPLVQAGLITFEVIPLKAYPGFERIHGEELNKTS